MKTNSTQQSLVRKVAAKLVFLIAWIIIFPVIVMAGILDKITHKVDANTRINSEKSKISPKNTNNSSSRGEAIGQEFNYPDRNVK